MICPDENYQNTHTYRFRNVFNGLNELQSAFDRVYAPLVRQTIAGESTLMAFCGHPFSDSIEYFTSVNGRAGIINMTTQLLLRAACTDATKPGTVTLSWYKIDCGPSEAVTDLLRSASSQPAHRGADPNLVLRELGKGRGMIVPGLWEVELTTPQDADAVIDHVLKMLPTGVHDGKSHSVFQLTISPYDQAQTANYQHVGSRATIIDDSRSTGRLTMVLLSDLGPRHNPSCTESPSPSVVERYDWVNIAYDILHWIESRQPSPPFHRSRLMLLLRDAVCCRMDGVISLFLEPSLQSLLYNSSWLDLVTKIGGISDQRLSAVNAVDTATKALTEAQLNSLLAASAGANIPPPGSFSKGPKEITSPAQTHAHPVSNESATKAISSCRKYRSTLDADIIAKHDRGQKSGDNMMSTQDRNERQEVRGLRGGSLGHSYEYHNMEYPVEEEKYSSSLYGDSNLCIYHHNDENHLGVSCGKDDGSRSTAPRHVNDRREGSGRHGLAFNDTKDVHDYEQGGEQGEREYVSETERMVQEALEARRRQYRSKEESREAVDLSSRGLVDKSASPPSALALDHRGFQSNAQPVSTSVEGSLDSEVCITLTLSSVSPTMSC